MFRSIVVLLTVSASLAHAALGCCWHHRHADESAVTLGAVQVGAQEHGDREGNEHGDHDSQPCEEENCTVVLSSPVKLPRCASGLFEDAVAAPATRFAALAASLSLDRTPIATLSGFPPSLRVHALTQVWLL